MLPFHAQLALHTSAYDRPREEQDTVSYTETYHSGIDNTTKAMLFTRYLVLAGAALGAAAPSELANKASKPKQFAVTEFVFGCTDGCYWNFKVAVQGEGPNHPPVQKPVECSGSLDDNKDYVDCGEISKTQTIRAYIVKATNELMLKYEVQKPKQGAMYQYTGEKKVYAATNDPKKLQKSSFIVKETSPTRVV
ncbi:hypothetical protein DOTSEDRAFT_51158 [Dothistroma septosporum NZE10]|uniref:Uncharacterized protein n=1 Tax=Dothistroma septosporum (strain NZE10 / CBS 128990) TaxID=675120 RepID=N1PXX9_DOTSN|nr:hypothetical protein DOTSEDRAFT_51158 [Dothistroma septosporum NZE10]